MQSSGHFWKNFSNNYLLCTHCHCHNVSLSCFHILAPNDKRALNCWNKHIMNSVLNRSLFQESSPTPRAARWCSTTRGRTSSSTSPTPARRRSPPSDGKCKHFCFCDRNIFVTKTLVFMSIEQWHWHWHCCSYWVKVNGPINLSSLASNEPNGR